VAGCEHLDADDLHAEDVMLRLRLRRGLSLSTLSPVERRRADSVVAEGLAEPRGDRLVLSDRGRLLADGVVRTLLDG
jgi:oxygen-independent coproporphyrinogen-3 oxidase